jgi:hypothetical protein
MPDCFLTTTNNQAAKNLRLVFIAPGRICISCQILNQVKERLVILANEKPVRS